MKANYATLLIGVMAALTFSLSSEALAHEKHNFTPRIIVGSLLNHIYRQPTQYKYVYINKDRHRQGHGHYVASTPKNRRHWKKKKITRKIYKKHRTFQPIYSSHW